MDLLVLRDLCLAFPEAFEDQPFGPDTLVFKVGGKLFALITLEALPPRLTLKCDSERAAELRDRYAAITTSPHFHKRHWNAVVLDGRVPTALVRSMVEDSYHLVVGGLRKADRERLHTLWDARPG